LFIYFWRAVLSCRPAIWRMAGGACMPFVLSMFGDVACKCGYQRPKT